MKRMAGVFLLGLLVGIIVTVFLMPQPSSQDASATDMTRCLVLTQGQAVSYDLLGPGTYRYAGRVDGNVHLLFQVVPTGDIARLVYGVPIGLVREDSHLVKYEPEIPDWL
jgi:hypothetical protein